MTRSESASTLRLTLQHGCGARHREAGEDLEAPLPLSRVISRSGTIPVVASGGASMLYRAYCSCGEAQSRVSQNIEGRPGSAQRCRLCSHPPGLEMGRAMT